MPDECKKYNAPPITRTETNMIATTVDVVEAVLSGSLTEGKPLSEPTAPLSTVDTEETASFGDSNDSITAASAFASTE